MKAVFKIKVRDTSLGSDLFVEEKIVIRSACNTNNFNGNVNVGMCYNLEFSICQSTENLLLYRVSSRLDFCSTVSYCTACPWHHRCHTM